MARVRQFANDLGINYNQAKDLINKGRSRKDNGSRILDKTRSKMMKNGGSNDLGMQSVKYGLDNNPAITAADPKAKFIAAANKKKKPMKAKDGASINKEFPEPEETTAEFRIEMIPEEYRESFRKKFMSRRGETSRKVEKKAGGGMPKMPKYRDGGAFRGCGAQVKGKKFKGIF